MLVRLLIFVLAISIAPPTTRAAEETLGHALKKIFSTPTPSPHRKKKTTATPSPSESPEESASPSPSASGSPHRKKKSSPTPLPSETPAPSQTPEAPVPSPQRGAPNATLLPEQIKSFENYPENVKKILASALDLTTRNLTYKYGSDDPNSGGMDCSGFVYRSE